MRLNVYAEELTLDTEVVSKSVVPNGREASVTFYGVRFYLHSAKELHHSATDDDRSAITLWVPWTAKDGNQPKILWDLFGTLKQRTADIQYAISGAALPVAGELDLLP